MAYIDTHAHLNDEAFVDDWQEVLDRAVQAGVSRVIVAGFDLASSEKAVAMAEARPEAWATVGVHPEDASKTDGDYLDKLRRMAASPRVIALGEIGLDYHYDDSNREDQWRVFREQLALARELGLPVVVHDREAHADTLQLMREAGPLPGGVMHCYAGNLPMAKDFADLGLAFSLGGTMTFNNAHRVREVAAGLPRHLVMLETDCPYLTPVPHRGKRNEPAYIPLVAEVLAGVWGVTAGEVQDLTTANAVRVFGLEGEKA